MARVIGIRFRKAGKVYYFDPAECELGLNDYVVVETVKGLELGQAVTDIREVPDGELEQELKPVLHKATDSEMRHSEEFAEKEQEAYQICSELVTKLELPMKLLRAEYNLDGSHLTIYFTAEDRVDFRQLVRELNSQLKKRVELRQIGPRDEAKVLGGLGRCGRPLCCATFLSDFEPVAIKMAKDQDLPLDPMKISGLCGRLMCCLGYECEAYREIKSKMPRIGKKVTVPQGGGFITGSNVLKETLMVELETSKAIVEVPLAEIKEYDGRAEPRPAAPEQETPAAVAVREPEQETQPSVTPDSVDKAVPEVATEGEETTATEGIEVITEEQPSEAELEGMSDSGEQADKKDTRKKKGGRRRPPRQRYRQKKKKTE